MDTREVLAIDCWCVSLLWEIDGILLSRRFQTVRDLMLAGF